MPPNNFYNKKSTPNKITVRGLESVENDAREVLHPVSYKTAAAGVTTGTCVAVTTDTSGTSDFGSS